MSASKLRQISIAYISLQATCTTCVMCMQCESPKGLAIAIGNLDMVKLLWSNKHTDENVSLLDPFCLSQIAQEAPCF